MPSEVLTIIGAALSVVVPVMTAAARFLAALPFRCCPFNFLLFDPALSPYLELEVSIVRDIFGVEAPMLLRTEQDLGRNLPPCIQSIMSWYHYIEHSIKRLLTQPSKEELRKAEEESESRKNALLDPDLLRHVSVYLSV